jgi:hypothetical protein
MGLLAQPPMADLDLGTQPCFFTILPIFAAPDHLLKTTKT